jgi:membrane protease subunit HflK
MNTVNNNPDFNDLKIHFKGSGGGILGVVVVLLLFVSVMGSFYTVEPDEEAVIIRLGRYIRTDPSGLHFKIPYVDKMIKVKTTRVHQAEFGFRTTSTKSNRTQYSTRNFDSESLMLTGDLNVADMEWVAQYKISDPFKFLFKTSAPIKNIRDVSESIMRRVVGDRLVSEVLTTGRMAIEEQARVLMQEVLDKYDMGVRIITIKLQDVNPPELVKASFNEVNAAKQEQEKLINQAEREYNRLVPEAKGKADKEISEAEGFATALVNRSYGDAHKFKALLKEYKRAPAIYRKRIYLETMEEVFMKTDDMTIIDSSIKGVLPVFGKSLSGN